MIEGVAVKERQRNATWVALHVMQNPEERTRINGEVVDRDSLLE